MRLSSMADYAVVAMTAAARHGDARQVSAAQLACETGLPAPTVQKLVSRLVAAGLLRSARGAGGGVLLARAADAISLAEIIEAVEGPIALVHCVESGRQECTLHQGCVVRPHWAEVNEALRGALAGVPLSKLAAMPRDNIPPGNLPLDKPISDTQIGADPISATPDMTGSMSEEAGAPRAAQPLPAMEAGQ